MISPVDHWYLALSGADDEDRTHDLSLTKGVLYHWATSAEISGALLSLLWGLTGLSR